MLITLNVGATSGGFGLLGFFFSLVSGMCFPGTGMIFKSGQQFLDITYAIRTATDLLHLNGTPRASWILKKLR